MSSDGARDLLVRGIAAAKTGTVDEARFYLDWVLRYGAPQDMQIEAWYWLSQVAEDPAEKRRHLEEVLARNPAHPQARRSLAILDGKLKPEGIVDPNRMPERPPTPAGDAPAERFTCPRCGGRLTAVEEKGTLACAYCGWRRSIEGAAAGDAGPGRDFVVAMAGAPAHRRPRAAPTFRCPACGAPYLLSPETISLTCPHCSSAFAIEHAQSEELIPPDGLIPFGVGEGEAARVAAAQTGQPASSIRLLRLYVPVWSFGLSGQVRWTGRQYDDRRETWVPVTGGQIVLEKDRLVPASPRLAQDWQRAVLEFDLKARRPFESAFLADVPAETYQVPMSDAAVVAHAEVFHQTCERVRREMPADVSDVGFDSTGFTIDSFQLLLAPVWLGPEGPAGSGPLLVINGQTGSVGVRTGKPRGWLGRILGLD
jgi:DNA-directed RNA polymerase subunit RPC12/RpoP